ncbi:MAG: hypothetical protein ACFFD4_40085 [Candidatus Odinarchaeota archaeon]
MVAGIVDPKIVYVSDIVGSKLDLQNTFDELLYSVVPYYNNSSKAEGFRDNFNNHHRLIYDSGGFSFLTGKLKGEPDPEKTVQLYKKMGYTSKDLLIQLDLPPAHFNTIERNFELIETSANYYFKMAEEIPQVVPVIHGWTVSELRHSLDLLQNISNDYRAFGCNRVSSTVSFGTYRVTESVLATPVSFDETVLKHRMNKMVTKKVIFDRLYNVSQILKDFKVFAMGGSNPNVAHLLFWLGFKTTDGAAWRLNATWWTIYLPEKGSYSIGKTTRNKKLDEEGEILLANCGCPVCKGLSPAQRLEILQAGKSRGFHARAIHNAWCVKQEELIANDYSCDPDGYTDYLIDRWRDNRFWKKWFKYMRNRVKKNEIQEDLMIYFKVK